VADKKISVELTCLNDAVLHIGDMWNDPKKRQRCPAGLGQGYGGTERQACSGRAFGGHQDAPQLAYQPSALSVHSDRNRAAGEYLLGNTSRHQSIESSEAMRCHDNEVDSFMTNGREDLFGRVTKPNT